jgi:hypothetical protein
VLLPRLWLICCDRRQRALGRNCQQAGPPPAHERRPAAGRPARDALSAQEPEDGLRRLSGEQLDVAHPDAAHNIEFFGQLRAQRNRNGEPLPDRAAGGSAGDVVAGQRVPHQRIGVQGIDQLDFGRTAAGGRPSDPDGQAIVVRRPQDDLPGYAEEAAGVCRGQAGADVQPDEGVGGHGHPVLPVEPSPRAHPDAASTQAVAHRALRDPGDRGDVAGAEARLGVQPLHDLVQRGLFLVDRPAPARAPGLDRDAGPGQHPAYPLPVNSRHLADAVGGQAVAQIEMADQLYKVGARVRSTGGRADARHRVQAASIAAVRGHAASLLPGKQGPLAADPQV